MSTEKIGYLDIVTVVRDLEDLNLKAGDTGTVIEVLGEEVFLVEFVPPHPDCLHIEVLTAALLEMDTKFDDTR